MSTPLAAPALPVFPTQPRGKQDVDHCSNEHICDGRGVLRFGVHARAKSRVRDQGQHQLQRRAHLPRAGTALLRQDRNQLEQRGTLVLHRAGSCRCRLAKSEGLTSPALRDWPAFGAVGGGAATRWPFVMDRQPYPRGRHWPVVKPIFRAVRERYRPMIPAAKSDALNRPARSLSTEEARVAAKSASSSRRCTMQIVGGCGSPRSVAFAR
jgi:hypothetical protein